MAEARWVYIVVGLIIGLIIGAPIGYYLRPAPQPGAAVTTTVTATETVTETKTVTKPPTEIVYRLGFAMAVSGPYAVDGPVRRDAAILAIEHINNYLKSIGSPVRFEYVHDDTKGRAEDALKVVESMYAAGIRVIVGPFSSGEVRGVLEFANTNKIVVISPSSTSPLLAQPDYVFRVVPTDLFQAKVLAQLVSYYGIKKIAVIARNDDYGKGLTDAFEKVFTEKYGGTVKKLLYTVGQPDYAAEVSQLSAMVSELGADETTAVLIIAFEDDGLNIFGHARLDPVLTKVRWFGAETIRRPAAYLPPKAPPEIAEFMASVKMTGVFASVSKGPLTAFFEKEYKSRFGRDPSPYAYFSYDAVWLAAMAILYAGKYDGEAVKNALPIVAEHFMGVTGYKAFDENGDAAGSDYTIWQLVYEAGKYTFKDIGVWKYPAETFTFYGGS